MGHRWLDDLLARLGRLPEAEIEPHPDYPPVVEPTLLYWRIYETTPWRVHRNLPPVAVLDGYPTRREAVIAAYRLNRHASLAGWPERYVVGERAEPVPDPLAGRCLR